MTNQELMKFQYVLEYKLFEKVDLGCAEELIDEYKDFYEYNRTQVAQSLAVSPVDTFDGQPREDDDAQRAVNEQKIQHNRNVSVDHFEKLFGSKDFTEACLVGLKIDFYELQKILMSEHRREIPITESALNRIALKLRTLASALLYAERIVSELQRIAENGKDEKAGIAVEFARDGFSLLLERLATQDIPIPEYNSNKKELGKIKTTDAYINYCEKLFFAMEEK